MSSARSSDSAPIAARIPGVRSGISGARREAHRAVDLARGGRKGTACGARRDVSVERPRGRRRAVRRRGGRRLPDERGCSSCPSVDWERREVPPVSSEGVDDITRLFLAARDGDRTALFHAVRESQADVWRLATHLVGRRRRRRRHPGHLRTGLAGLARVPGRVQRPHLAALNRPPSLRRRGPGPGPAAPAGRAGGGLGGPDSGPSIRRSERTTFGRSSPACPATSGTRSCSRR